MRCALFGLFLPILVMSSAASAKDALEIEMIDDEKYAEQVVGMADLTGGVYVKIRFGISNVGPGDGKAGCEFQVIEKDGSILQDEVVVEKDGWGYDSAKATLSIGPCSASDGGRLKLRAPLGKGTVTIELLSKPSRRRVHEAKYGDEFYELDMLIPWAEAKVTIEAGGKTRTLSGHGYADHPRSKILPAKLAEKWFRFRGLNAADPRVVMIRLPKGESPVGWHESKRGRTELDRVMLAPDGKKAWRARFKGKDGEWRVTTMELLHRSAPVEDRGAAIGALIGAVVGNPVTYTFRGVLEERGSGAKIHGLVEVTVTDE
jgi:hypothetical protein